MSWTARRSNNQADTDGPSAHQVRINQQFLDHLCRRITFSCPGPFPFEHRIASYVKPEKNSNPRRTVEERSRRSRVQRTGTLEKTRARTPVRRPIETGVMHQC